VPWRTYLPKRAPSLRRGVLLGLGFAALAFAVRVALPELGRQLPFITAFPALIFASAFGGLVGGATCLVAATLAAWWLAGSAGIPVWAYIAFWCSGGLVVATASATGDTVRRLRAVEGELRTVVRELGHRNRNALAVIMSIVSQSARVAGSAEEAERIINARLDALVRAQGLIVESQDAAAGLSALLDRTLEPFDLARFSIRPGAPCEIHAQAAVALGLVFHELATNAVKYGALSAPAGQVQISWAVESQVAHLTWREVGGPPPAEDGAAGFGSRLLASALSPQGGRAERRLTPEGAICELWIPLSDHPEGPMPGASSGNPGRDAAHRTAAQALAR
jgi:two-component sensor histidine kinase